MDWTVRCTFYPFHPIGAQPRQGLSLSPLFSTAFSDSYLRIRADSSPYIQLQQEIQGRLFNTGRSPLENPKLENRSQLIDQAITPLKLGYPAGFRSTYRPP